jgi:hypothetical protein
MRPSVRKLGVALLALLFAAGAPARVTAQSAGEARDPSDGIRIHVGMWIMHLANPGRGFKGSWFVAVGGRGLYGATFVNSFGRRSFAAGIERSLAEARDRTVSTGLGYRLGLVTGYDERLLSLASKTPLLPVLQMMGDVAVGPTGMEFAWAAKVASIGPYMRVMN